MLDPFTEMNIIIFVLLAMACFCFGVAVDKLPKGERQ